MASSQAAGRAEWGGREVACIPALLLRWRLGCCGPPTTQQEGRADFCREDLYLLSKHACIASFVSDLLICESCPWKLLEGGPSETALSLSQ